VHNILNLSSKNFPIQLFAKDIDSVNFLKDLAIVSLSSSKFSGDASETNLLTLFQIFSVGFKSGEYEGR